MTAGNTSNQNRVLVACGFRGSGKTTYVQNILKKQLNIFVYDPNEDEAYSWIPNTGHSLTELQERIGSDATDKVLQLGEHEAVVFDVGTRSYFIADSHGEILSEVRGGFTACSPDDCEETESPGSENDNRIVYFRKKA